MPQKIALTKDKVAIVDDVDFERVNAFKWFAHNPTGKDIFYALHRFQCNKGKSRRTLLMHRFILNAPDGIKIDHINRNGLDNRRCNLRYANDQQNQANMLSRRSRSGFKGVHVHIDKRWRGGKKHWRARIKVNYKDISLGYFDDRVKAAKAYDKAAKAYFGQFARLNFPTEAGEIG